MPPSNSLEMGVLCKLHVSALHLGPLVLPETWLCQPFLWTPQTVTLGPRRAGGIQEDFASVVPASRGQDTCHSPLLPRLVMGIEAHKVEPCGLRELLAKVQLDGGLWKGLQTATSSPSESILGACRSLGPAGAGVAQPHPLPPSHPTHTPEPPTPSDLTISCTLCCPPLGATVRARKGPAPNPTKLLLTCVLCVLQTFLSAVAGKPTNPC